MKRRLRTPSPAFVISLIALFVALGGTTYAATSLPKNSVVHDAAKEERCHTDPYRAVHVGDA
jgi:hypothetical protein